MTETKSLVIAEFLRFPVERATYLREVQGSPDLTSPNDTPHHRWTGHALMTVLHSLMLDDLVLKTRLERGRLTDILFREAVPSEEEYNAIVGTFPEVTMKQEPPIGIR